MFYIIWDYRKVTFKRLPSWEINRNSDNSTVKYLVGPLVAVNVLRKCANDGAFR